MMARTEEMAAGHTTPLIAITTAAPALPSPAKIQLVCLPKGRTSSDFVSEWFADRVNV